MIMKATEIIIISALLVLLCGCTLQEEAITVDLRLAVLEERIAALERSDVGSERNLTRLETAVKDHMAADAEEDQKSRDRTARLYAMIEKLREEVQVLSGKIEEGDYSLGRRIRTIEKSDKKREGSRRDTAKTASVNRDRILRLERYLDFEIDDKLGKKIPFESTKRDRLTDAEVYALAKKAFDAREFETARRGFEKLIKEFPKSNHADNAQFWIGEIHYDQEWYERAILEYQKVIENYPTGNKVPASLLKQGLSFSKLRDRKNAQLILEELVRKHPKSSEADVARKRIKELQQSP